MCPSTGTVGTDTTPCKVKYPGNVPKGLSLVKTEYWLESKAAYFIMNMPGSWETPYTGQASRLGRAGLNLTADQSTVGYGSRTVTGSGSGAAKRWNMVVNSFDSFDAHGLSGELGWLPLPHWYGKLLLKVGQDLGHHANQSQVFDLGGLDLGLLLGGLGGVLLDQGGDVVILPEVHGGVLVHGVQGGSIGFF